MSARRLPRSVALLAALWLAIGYVNVARGAWHTGGGYRFWAFQHHCYSDIIALHGDRYLGGAHPLPYLHDHIEYPPLLGLFLWLPSWAPSGAIGHFTVTYALLALCLAAALWALARTDGADAFWLGATPALVYYAGLNWDLLPIALVALAVLALARGRAGGAGALAAAGVTAKLFPAVLAPAAWAGLLGRREPGARGLERGAVAFAVAGAGTLVLLNAPVALAAWDGYTWFFRFNAGRGAENSLWDALGLVPGPLLEALSTAPFVVATLAAALAAYRAARRSGGAGEGTGASGADAPWLDAVRVGTALALVVWIATNKIWSPQYALYGFLAGALAGAPRAWFWPLALVSVVDFHLAFQVRALRWDPWFRDFVWHPGNIARSLVWLGFAAWLVRRLWRGATLSSS
ncbi:MAG: glycosyltransferase 87 family protein [Anaeromyxobacteraceae bacterium]